jgi:toxin ParE1/3/4
MRWIRKDSPRAAKKFGQEVLRAAERLGEFPESGPHRPELGVPNVRVLSLAHFPYVLVYDPELPRPTILRVMHGARDLPNVFGDAWNP